MTKFTKETHLDRETGEIRALAQSFKFQVSKYNWLSFYTLKFIFVLFFSCFAEYLKYGIV